MIKLIVTDLDNTLYDWVGYYVPAFVAMVTELEREHGVEREKLLDAFQRVHRRHGTSEYAFALTELDVLHDVEALAANQSMPHPAIAAFREVAEQRLRLYDGVMESLLRLRDSGNRIVAYTDAMMSYADLRLAQLGVAETFDELVATRDHAMPQRLDSSVSYFDAKLFTRWSVREHTELTSEQRKPNPDGLRRLMARHGVRPSETVMIGDSLTNDVAMAQAAGVHDVHARYGRSYPPELWERLVRVTHWTPADVQRERATVIRPVTPTRTVDAFEQLLDVIGEIDRDGNETDVAKNARCASATTPAPSRYQATGSISPSR